MILGPQSKSSYDFACSLSLKSIPRHLLLHKFVVRNAVASHDNLGSGAIITYACYNPHKTIDFRGT